MTLLSVHRRRGVVNGCVHADSNTNYYIGPPVFVRGGMPQSTVTMTVKFRLVSQYGFASFLETIYLPLETCSD